MFLTGWLGLFVPAWDLLAWAPQPPSQALTLYGPLLAHLPTGEATVPRGSCE